MVAPSQRTLVVLGALLLSMTLATGLLTGLEPGGSAPPSLTVVDRAPAAEEALFTITPGVAQTSWSAIAVHFSGSGTGSAQGLDAQQKTRYGGLAYHMVVGNGTGSSDGQLELGYRWQFQKAGISNLERISAFRNSPVIDICLVGDGISSAPTPAQMDKLVWLVQNLQRRLRIPAERVFIYRNPASAHDTFPVAKFQQQLLKYGY